MAEGVRAWYAANGVKFAARGLAIDQWGGDGPMSIGQQLAWLDVRVVNARDATLSMTGYLPGQQAPCRACANVRRSVSDSIVSGDLQHHADVIVLARGLHLSDTAISLLWRMLRGRPAEGKWKPLENIAQNFYLAKPLAYAREYESAAYAHFKGHRHHCCGCPACAFPSRRDIVEETAAELFDGATWELDVPGVEAYLRCSGTSREAIARLSAPGRHPKRRHIPLPVYDFAIDELLTRLRSAPLPWDELCDSSLNLDDLALQGIKSTMPPQLEAKLPTPALVLDAPMSFAQRAMIATMGPFWGAFALHANQRRRAFEIQIEQWGTKPDDEWTQVNALLHRFRASGSSPAGRRHLTVL